MPETTIITLPDSFKPDSFVSFYQRDPEEVCERVRLPIFQKAMVRNGSVEILEMKFQEQVVQASLKDGSCARNTLVTHILGLDQPVADFEDRFGQHPEIGILIQRNPGIRIPQLFSRFEALIWAIAGQQISVKAAVSVRRKLILMAELRHKDGLYAHPEPEHLIHYSTDDFRRIGCSQSKAQTIRTLCEEIHSRKLDLKASPERLREALLQIKGIGPWTADYVLLRSCAYLEASLHLDGAVQRNLQKLLNLKEKPTPEFTRKWLALFQPYQAFAAAHLWAMQSLNGF